MSTVMELPEIFPKVESLPAAARGCAADRPLPVLCIETVRSRWAGLGLIAVVIGLYAVMTFTFWAPADGGVDQNAYLLGGRMIAEHFTPKYTLPNPYAYVGGMFIRTSKLGVMNGDYYPKYPFGLPLIYASFFWILGPVKAATAAFAVSPTASVIAVLGMFFLARVVAGSFAGLMAAILLATSQLMIVLSTNANSHATCLAFIVWGMYCLIKWWQTGWMWLGILAGFLIGYAGLVRYSEGLLVLPIAVACASRLRWTDWRSYVRCSVPGLAWAVPIAALLIFNKYSMGNWTGYDSTNESEGFTWLKFTQTWEQMIRTYYDMGAFFVLPFGLAGLVMIFARSPKLGLMLLTWLLPGTALYTAYYWSPDRGVAYARFILTFIPVVMLGAAICFQDGLLAPSSDAAWYHRLPRTLSVVVIVGIAGGLGVYRSIHGMQQGTTGGGGGGMGMTPLAETYRAKQSLANTGKVLLNHVPVNSVLFAENNGGGGGNEKPLNYIQFLRHWDLYAADAFDESARGRGNGNGRRGNNFFANAIGMGNPANPDPNNDPNNQVPTTRQKLQADYVDSIYQNKTADQLRKEELAVIQAAHKAGHGVFALVATARDREMRRSFNLIGKYKITEVETWKDLPALEPDTIADANGNGGRRNRGNFGGGGGGGGGGRRGGGGGGLFANGGPANAEPTEWELLEIKPAV